MQADSSHGEMRSHSRDGETTSTAPLQVSIAGPGPTEELQAVLAEYNALRTEIQSRSNTQSILLQLHVTSLTIILGAALSQKLGLWLVFLVPLESAFLGMWWLDHALVIMEIGTYIRTSVEPSVAKVLRGKTVMRWEAGFMAGITGQNTKRVISFNRLVFMTFGLPMVLGTTYGLVLTAAAGLLDWQVLPQQLVRSWKLVPAFAGNTAWAALAFLILDGFFAVAYLSLSAHRSRVDYMLEKKHAAVK